jgi:hypothetical protein
MEGSQGDCKFISNHYWVAETTTGARLASFSGPGSRELRFTSNPHTTVKVIGIDDKGRVAFQTRESRDGGPYVYRVEALELDGGILSLLAPPGGEPTVDTIETSGVLAGQIRYGGAFELGIWRLEDRDGQPLTHLPMPPYLAQTTGVSAAGDACGVYYGLPVRSFLLPAGYARLLNSEEFGTLAALECRAVLDVGAFLFVSPRGEPSRTVVVLLRRGGD